MHYLDKGGHQHQKNCLAWTITDTGHDLMKSVEHRRVFISSMRECRTGFFNTMLQKAHTAFL